MARRLFYTDHHILPLPAGHKFPIAKYRMLRDLLGGDRRFRFEAAPLASSEIIELIHDPTYVRAFMAGTLDTAAMRRIGFPWSEQLVRRTLASVGGTLAAAEEALQAGWGGTLAGGTHHAFAGEGSGFCVFNDIAVAIATLRQSGKINRAAVVDLDVHQGDGTAHIFRDDPEVLTLSVHCKNNFPLRKQQSDIDVELAAATADEKYLEAVARVLPRVFDLRPDIVFYQSGVDGLDSDVLGRLSLSAPGLERRDRMVFDSARDRGIPIVITLGGGYSDPICLTAEAHANTFRLAAEIMEN